MYFAFLDIAPFPCPMIDVMYVHVQWWKHAGSMQVDGTEAPKLRKSTIFPS